MISPECSPIILHEETLKIVYTCKKSNLKRLLKCGGEPSAACFRTRVETDEFQRFVGRIILLKSKNNTREELATIWNPPADAEYNFIWRWIVRDSVSSRNNGSVAHEREWKAHRHLRVKWKWCHTKLGRRKRWKFWIFWAVRIYQQHASWYPWNTSKVFYSSFFSFHRDDVIVSQGQECLANRRGSFVLRLTVGGIWK